MKNDVLIHLLSLIEDQLGWGDSANWPSKDFERLNILIQERTKVSISASTLRRLWGKVDYNNQPSVTTLDTLAMFAGFEDWRSFCILSKKTDLKKPTEEHIIKTRSFRQFYTVVVAVSVVAIITLSFLFIPSGSSVGVENYVFGFHPVTRDLPNSVIFTYDARSAPDDSVFIQQSWDNTRRTRVSKKSHLFSSIYYKPGFYHAKLVIGNQVVKESPLLIPTRGWLGMIDMQPVPVYLDPDEFISKNGMSVSASTILKHKVLLEPQPPIVAFYNTGNFKPISVLNFSYSAEVKNTYKTGASRCQYLNVILFTSGIPISIPLSAPGCIASLSMLDGVKEIDGSSTDLSAFGADLSKWVRLSCISRNGQISILVNNKLAYKYQVADQHISILGLGFRFHGIGEVRHVALSGNNKEVLTDL
ncbi:hypothetical protein SAMN06265348_10182 [Pedobacter westerhofensis]|uniref:PKD domain-containing protein n=1 Tax=Pedobacter westerhofensis TaxID=425512 RepID=A0A521ADK3_9SPHI|nr:hypothetical protein [Pedobacter westerhofensis]SMO32893.1 hypothetical protein SAMN06265348_10182 [Pedobacter westerhofensis]